MTIYRIEDKNGDGPYWSRQDFPNGHLIHRMTADHCSDEIDHSGILSDVISLGRVSEFTKYHLCAFVSKDQMLDWFDDWIYLLEEWGFNLVEITIDPIYVIETPTQAAFDSMKVLCKKQIPISSVCPATACT